MNKTEDMFFTYSLIASLMIHVVAVAVLSFKTHKIRQETKMLEVIYQQMRRVEKVPAQTKTSQNFRLPDEPKQMPVDMMASKKEISPFGKNDFKDISKQPVDFKLGDKLLDYMENFSVKPTVVISQDADKKIDNPVYTRYMASVRQKILEKAYEMSSQRTFSAGSVYLTFVIQSAGTLGGVKVIGRKTRADGDVQELSLNIIQRSAPFEPIPKELNYPELTCNVEITFKK